MKTSMILGGAGLTSAWPQLAAALSKTWPVPPPTFKSQAAFVKTNDRAAQVKKALELLNLNPIEGKKLFLLQPAAGNKQNVTPQVLFRKIYSFKIALTIVIFIQKFLQTIIAQNIPPHHSAGLATDVQPTVSQRLAEGPRVMTQLVG